ncbi:MULTISPECIES: hypothetical protein [Campylobacter]|nr:MULTISPECIES: hypothetical protein [unclassified Campylobacter]
MKIVNGKVIPLDPKVKRLRDTKERLHNRYKKLTLMFDMCIKDWEGINEPRFIGDENDEKDIVDLYCSIRNELFRVREELLGIENKLLTSLKEL